MSPVLRVLFSELQWVCNTSLVKLVEAVRFEPAALCSQMSVAVASVFRMLLRPFPLAYAYQKFVKLFVFNEGRTRYRQNTLR